MNEIAAVTSEKGDGYDATSTDFKIGSMFNVVEKKIFNDADFYCAMIWVTNGQTI